MKWIRSLKHWFFLWNVRVHTLINLLKLQMDPRRSIPTILGQHSFVWTFYNQWSPTVHNLAWSGISYRMIPHSEISCFCDLHVTSEENSRVTKALQLHLQCIIGTLALSDNHFFPVQFMHLLELFRHVPTK